METGAKSAVYPEQELTQKILKASFAVHNALGAGFLEKVYSNALMLELRSMGLNCNPEVAFRVKYKNVIVGDYCADLVVESRALVELKACTGLDSVHDAQILNYLKASGIRVGVLMNFAKPRLEYRRFVL
jgi:GxxExxY protein